MLGRPVGFPGRPSRSLCTSAELVCSLLGPGGFLQPCAGSEKICEPGVLGLLDLSHRAVG